LLQKTPLNILVVQHLTCTYLSYIPVRPHIDVRLIHWVGHVPFRSQDRLIPVAKVLQAAKREGYGRGLSSKLGKAKASR